MRVATSELEALEGEMNSLELSLLLFDDDDRCISLFLTLTTQKLTVYFHFPLKIVFQGIRGDGYLSDFALDDITLENNPCGLGLMRFMTVNNRKLSGFIVVVQTFLICFNHC